MSTMTNPVARMIMQAQGPQRRTPAAQPSARAGPGYVAPAISAGSDKLLQTLMMIKQMKMQEEQMAMRRQAAQSQQQESQGMEELRRAQTEGILAETADKKRQAQLEGKKDYSDMAKALAGIETKLENPNLSPTERRMLERQQMILQNAVHDYFTGEEGSAVALRAEVGAEPQPEPEPGHLSKFMDLIQARPADSGEVPGLVDASQNRGGAFADSGPAIGPGGPGQGEFEDILNQQLLQSTGAGQGVGPPMAGGTEFPGLIGPVGMGEMGRQSGTPGVTDMLMQGGQPGQSGIIQAIVEALMGRKGNRASALPPGAIPGGDARASFSMLR